jgi:hypothetical protein
MNRHAHRLHPAQEHFHCHARKRLIGALAGKDDFLRSAICGFIKYRQSPARERHAMFAPSLHANCGNRPDFRNHFHFSPSRAEYFARASRRQDQEFEGHRRYGRSLAQFAGMMAARELLALRQELVEMPAPPGRVRLIAGYVSFGARRVQDGFYPAPKP